MGSTRVHDPGVGSAPEMRQPGPTRPWRPLPLLSNQKTFSNLIQTSFEWSVSFTILNSLSNTILRVASLFLRPCKFQVKLLVDHAFHLRRLLFRESKFRSNWAVKEMIRAVPSDNGKFLKSSIGSWNGWIQPFNWWRKALCLKDKHQEIDVSIRWL